MFSSIQKRMKQKMGSKQEPKKEEKKVKETKPVKKQVRKVSTAPRAHITRNSAAKRYKSNNNQNRDNKSTSDVKKTNKPASTHKKTSSRGRGKKMHQRQHPTSPPRGGANYRNKKPLVLPDLPKETLRVIPIGGCEEVGRNMTIFEYGNDIVIIDMGMQFPEEDQPGIDYIVPNTSYLEGKEDRIRAVIFTHGHLDHIGAAPVLLEKLGNPPIVGRPLTLALIKHKQEDYKKNTSKDLKIVTVKTLRDKVKLGAFKASFFQVEHSIMDSMGVILETNDGTIIHPGDWTMERDAEGNTALDYTNLQELKKPTMLLLESLGSLNKERHGTYEEMYENLKNVISDAPGRIIIATFSSQVERVKWVIEAAKQQGKRVALDGYSMKMNIELAKELGYIKIAREALIDIRKIDDYKENEVVIICTGAQGEENAVLNRIASGRHRTVKLRRTDTVVFSSSIIPGNERTIQRLKDGIYRQCDNVIHGDIMDVHVSGHATQEDIIEIVDQIKPDYFVPIYANHFFLKEAKNLVVKHGFNKDKIYVPDNGSLIDLTRKGVKMHKEKANSDYVFVDGLGVSDSQHIVLRDRQVLAEDGMIVVIATIHRKTGKLVQNPDIISRGFVFLKDNKDLIEGVRDKVKKMVVSSQPKSWADTDQIKNDIRDKVGQYVYTKTQKRPMILPVVIEV